MKYRCAHCGKEADKPAGEVNRARERGLKLYCDRKCSGLGRRQGKTKAQVAANLRRLGANLTSHSGQMACEEGAAEIERLCAERDEARRQVGELDVHLFTERSRRMAETERCAKIAEELGRLWICAGCGTRKSLEQIKGEHPPAIACCPERKMIPAPSSVVE